MDWAYNQLWISVPNNDAEQISELSHLVHELIDADDNSPLTFFNHCPIPDCLIETNGDETPEIEADNEAQCGYRYLHQFTQSEWGCGFDADDVKGSFEDDEVAFYTFRTLHNAPLGWLQKISEAYPNLIFELDVTNEMELWDSFSVMYLGGKQISYLHDNDKQ